MKDIKKATICILIVYTILILGISFLYRFDNNSTNRDVLVEFIHNEAEYQYKGYRDSLNSIVDSSMSISTIVDFYRGMRFELELSKSGDSEDGKLQSQEDINERLEQLTPSGLQDADSFIMPYVYTLMYYDILVDLDKDCDDYWELAYNTMFTLSLHQYLLSRNPMGWLYNNCRDIALILVVLLIIAFSITMGRLIVYYMRLIGRKDKEG